jgi:peptidoglycan/xylan/chitin deacetylase (PgdA/CDA1 family)
MAFETTRWMKDRTKQALAPLARLATRNRARVLMYHRFGPGDPRKLSADVLDEQLYFLHRHFNVVPLGDLVTRLQSGAAFEPCTVALTVDDAYADFGEHAYPVFRKHGIPVTIYVVSEFASGRLWLWWDAIRHLLNQATEGQYRPVVANGRIDISLTDASSRHQAWLALAGIGVTLSPTERDLYLQELQSAFSLVLPAVPPREFAAMNWDELRALDPAIVDIGAHTRTHPILSRCDTPRIVDEVGGSKKEIEARLGRRVSAFCYPNGEWSDVDERCIGAVRDAGFDSAVMACGDMVGKGANRYALERMSAPHLCSDFKSDVSGIAFLRHRAGHLNEPSF